MLGQKVKKSTAFDLSWIRLPELYILREFNEKNLQDKTLKIREGDFDVYYGRHLLPSAPFRYLVVTDDKDLDRLEFKQENTKPSRNFTHEVKVGKSSNSFYYKGVREFIFRTHKKVWYDSSLELSLRGDEGKLSFSLVEKLNLAEFPILRLVSKWNQIVIIKERVRRSEKYGDDEGYKRLNKEVEAIIESIKSEWVHRSFLSLKGLNKDQSLKEMREIILKSFPTLTNLIRHDHLSDLNLRLDLNSYSRRKFQVNLYFWIDNKKLSIHPIKVKVGVPEKAFINSFKRVLSFYRDILGSSYLNIINSFKPDEEFMEFNPEIIEDVVWEDVNQLIQGLDIYQKEINQYKKKIIDIFDFYRQNNLKKYS